MIGSVRVRLRSRSHFCPDDLIAFGAASPVPVARLLHEQCRRLSRLPASSPLSVSEAGFSPNGYSIIEGELLADSVLRLPLCLSTEAVRHSH